MHWERIPEKRELHCNCDEPGVDSVGGLSNQQSDGCSRTGWELHSDCYEPGADSVGKLLDQQCNARLAGPYIAGAGHGSSCISFASCDDQCHRYHSLRETVQTHLSDEDIVD